jgi:succinoglycan biosynthesis transport protein ExoP
MSTAYIRQVLIRRSWIVVLVAMACGEAAYFIAHQTARQFTSSAQLSTEFETGRNSNSLALQTDFENLIEIMKTELISSMVSYNLLLNDLTDGAPFRRPIKASLPAHEYDSARVILKSKLRSFEQLSPYVEAERRLMELLDDDGYDVSRWIRDRDLEISRLGTTTFIRVAYACEDPFFSAFVVNTLCSEFVRYTNLVNKTISDDSLSRLGAEIERRRKYLDEVNNQLTSHEAKINHRQDAQLVQHEARLLDAENRVARLSARTTGIEKEISDRRVLVSKNRTDNPKLRQLQARIAELEKIHSENGSRDEKLASTIKGLHGQLESEVSRLKEIDAERIEAENQMSNLVAELDRTRLELKSALSIQSTLRTQVRNMKRGTVQTSVSREKLDSLVHEREAALRSYNLAVAARDMATSKETSALNGKVKLMIKAQPRVRPEASGAITLAVVAMLIGAVLSAAAIMVIAYRRTLRQPAHPTFVVTR